MANRIKIDIVSKDRTLHLPGIHFSLITAFLKIGLWGSRYIQDLDEEGKQFIKNNEALIISLINAVVEAGRDLEEFDLVEVSSKDDYVRIRVM